MTEYSSPITVIDTRMLDPYAGHFDLHDKKAILAMQATAACIEESSKFEGLNDRLLETADILGEPATITYEDVIFTNPVFGDVRVLSLDPTIATAEGRFYRSHRIIETSLELAIRKIMGLGNNALRFAQAETYTPPPIAESPYTVSPVQDLKNAKAEFLHLRTGLSREEFMAFRVYFKDGFNGYPGPSGLYSANIPILDLIANGGVNIQDGVREFIEEKVVMGMYPNRKGERDLMAFLLQESDSTMEMNDEIRTGIIDTLNRIRMHHDKAVQKHLPEVASGEAPGSGGISNYPELSDAKKVKL